MNSSRASSWTRSRSFALIVVLYLVAVAGSLLIASIIGSDHPVKGLIWGYVASVAFLYIASQIVGNGSTFDAWWSVIPPSFAIWFCIVLDDPGLFSDADLRRLAVAVCATLWGVRLTANWAIGWTGLDHEDWRYRMLYETAPMPRWAVSLTSVHLFPMIVVTLGSIPMAIVASHSDRSFGVLDGIAIVVALTGVALQQFADLDLRRFNRTKQPGDVLNTGLWSRSRHPNYLGGNVLVVVAFYLRPCRRTGFVVGWCRCPIHDRHVFCGQYPNRRKAQRRTSPRLGGLSGQHPHGVPPPS